MDISLSPKNHNMCNDCYSIVKDSSQTAPTSEKQDSFITTLGKKIFGISINETPKKDAEFPAVPGSIVSVQCCRCNEKFITPPSEAWKTLCRSCFRTRKCYLCPTDITETAGYRNLCDVCYSSQVVQKSCFKCNREFNVTRKDSYKNLCSRAECVDLTSAQQVRATKNLSKQKFSKKEILWLKGIATKEGITIQHAENGQQYIILTKLGPKRVDGYCYKNNTVYEFYGEHFHGHPTKDGIGVDGISYKDLYQRTMEREALIKAEGYKIISILESEYDAM